MRYPQPAVCRTDLVTAKKLPDPVPKAVETTHIESDSKIGLTMIILANFCGAVELVLMGTIIWKRGSKIIKAASKTFSILILLGKSR